MFVDETVMTQIGQAETLADAGDLTAAQAVYQPLWEQLHAAGDTYHACIVAHFMAHVQAEPAAQLDWHRRALHAAETSGDERVAGFYPSLHANLADTYLRLGDVASARQHVERAQATAPALDESGYGRMVQSLIDRLAAQLRSAADG